MLMTTLNHLKRPLPALLCTTLLTLTTHATAADAPPPGWQGEATLSYSGTAGNSESHSLSAKLKAKYHSQVWRGELRFDAIASRDQGTTTAEQYLASGRLERRFANESYLFGNLRYDNDRFSGYRYQVSDSFGYGYPLLQREHHKLELEAGVGHRQSETDAGAVEDSAIGRAALNYQGQLRDDVKFNQSLLIESGNDLTFTESESELKVAINGQLSLAINLTLRHKSDVPADTKATDSVSSIGLNYRF